MLYGGIHPPDMVFLMYTFFYVHVYMNHYYQAFINGIDAVKFEADLLESCPLESSAVVDSCMEREDAVSRVYHQDLLQHRDRPQNTMSQCVHTYVH